MNLSENYHTLLNIESCIASSNVLRTEFRHILLVIMLIDVPACLGFQYLNIFLFYYFIYFLLLVLLAATDYLWLFLQRDAL